MHNKKQTPLRSIICVAGPCRFMEQAIWFSEKVISFLGWVILFST